MAQHPLVLPNVDGMDLRAELNDFAEALATNNSGPSEPPNPFKFMWWADTTTGLLKQRAADNMSWITVGTLDTPNLGLATRGANTFTGAQNFNGQTLQRPVLRDYGEVVNALGSIAGPVAISTASGNVVTATVAGDVTFSFATSWPAGVASTITLRLTNGGAHGVTWPAGTKWPGGIVPALAVMGVDILTFITLDGSTSWFGVQVTPRAAPVFPQVTSVTPSTFTTLDTSHAVAMPAAVAAGDLLLAVLTSRAASLTTPAAWTAKLNAVFQGEPFTGSAGFGVFAKIADGSEASGTVNFETTTATPSLAAQVYRVRRWRGDLAGVAIGTAVAGSSLSPNPTSLTAPWGAARTLWIAAAGSVNDGEPFIAAPAGYSGLVSTVAAAGSNNRSAVGSAWLESEAASENAGAFMLDGPEAWAAVMIGVQPA